MKKLYIFCQNCYNTWWAKAPCLNKAVSPKGGVIMKNYEIMFIVRPDVEETVVKNTVKTLEKVLTDHKAKITLSKE